MEAPLFDKFPSGARLSLYIGVRLFLYIGARLSLYIGASLFLYIGVRLCLYIKKPPTPDSCPGPAAYTLIMKSGSNRCPQSPYPELASGEYSGFGR